MACVNVFYRFVHIQLSRCNRPVSYTWIEKTRPLSRTGFVLALPIFTPSHPGTIVGTHELNFCVRNGNRWTLAVINTNCKWHYITPFTSCQLLFSLGDPGGNRTHVNGVRGRCLNRLTTGPHSRTINNSFRCNCLVRPHGLEPGTH